MARTISLARPELSAFAAAVLLILAGCSGGSGSPDPGDGPATPDPPAQGTPGTPLGNTPDPNRAPVAIGDKAVANGGSLVISVLGNDFDADDDELSLLEVGPAQHGTTSMDNAGTPNDPADDVIVYTPLTGHLGSDLFSYTVVDPSGATAIGEVSILAAPAAEDRFVSTTMDSPVSIDVLTGNAAAIASFTTPAFGTVTLDDAGTAADTLDDRLTYTPATGYIGQDAFEFTLTGPSGYATAGATVEVTAVPAAPSPPNVSGQVAKGLVRGAVIRLFEMNDSGSRVGVPLAVISTDANGRWEATVPTPRTDLLVVATGGRYEDETRSAGTRQIIELTTSDELLAVLPADKSFTVSSVYTYALYLRARHAAGAANFAAAYEILRAAVTTNWNLDLAATVAADPSAPDPNLPDDSRRHALALGGAAMALNRVVSALGLSQPDGRTIQAFVRDLADCALDGEDFDGPITINVEGVDRSLVSNLNLNLEILRFRNNRASLYGDTALPVWNEQGCVVTEPPVDDQPPVVTVDLMRTSSPSPALSGGVDDPAATVVVRIAGQQYPATNLGNRWALSAGSISPGLADGVYDVVVEATDANGNVGIDETSSDIVVDFSAPIVTFDVLTTDSASPALSGTVDDPTATVLVTVAGSDFNAAVAGNSWSLPVGTLPPLAEGAYDVVVTATDSLGNSGIVTATSALTISINQPPAFSLSSDISEVEDFVGARIVTVTPDPVPADEASQVVTYRLQPASVGFADVTISPTTGRVTVVPLPDLSGTQTITVIADDGQSFANVSSQTFELSITPVNDAPAFGLSGNITESQDFVGVRSVSANSAAVPADEATQIVSYSLTPASVAFANVVIDPATGNTLITAVPGAFGVQTFVVTADDGQAQNGTATATFVLDIAQTVAGNVSPVISGQTALTMAEDTSLTLALSDLLVSDSDNNFPDDFTLSVQPGADYSVSGLTLTPDANFAGTLTVPVTVSDGAATSELFNVAIDVTPVNDPPAFLVGGNIAESEDFTGTRSITVTPTAVPGDETTQSPVYSLSPASVSFANVSIDAATGTVTVAAIANESGSQSFTLTADDGQSQNNLFSANFSVSVAAVNDAPVFTLSGDISETANFAGNRSVTVTPGAVPTDETGQGVSYSLSPATVAFADVVVDPTTGTVTVSSVTDASGTQLFTLAANDGQSSNNLATQNFNLTIVPDNQPPTVSAISDVLTNDWSSTSTVDLFAAFDDAEDPDTALTFAVINNTDPSLFDSIAIDGTAGTFTMAFVSAVSGTSTITLRATDTAGDSVQTSFDVTLNPLADLRIAALGADDSSPAVGEEVQFTLVLNNQGPSPATDVTVSVPLPGGYAYVTANNPPEYDAATGEWYRSQINGTATLVLTAEVLDPGPYVVTAEVTAANEADPDSTPGNADPTEDDYASITTTPRQVTDSSLSLTVDDRIPAPGGLVTLTATIQNFGPYDATGIDLSMPPLAGELIFLSSSVDSGSFNTSTGEWTGVVVPWSGDPAAPATATLIVTARVAASATPLSILEVTATISAADQADPDGIETDSEAMLVLADGLSHVWVGGAGPDPTDWENPDNWDSGLVPSPGDEVNIPLTAFDPNLSADALSLARLDIDTGAQILANGFTISIRGELDARNGPITGPGKVSLEWGKLRGSVPDLEIAALSSSAEVDFDGDVSVNGDLIISQGRLDIREHDVLVSGSLISTGSGILRQRTGSSEIHVAGDVLFDGGDYSQKIGDKFPLRAGTLFIGGDFVQSGQPHSFAAEDKHRVVFNGSGTQTVYMQNPDMSNPDGRTGAAMGSRFAILRVDKDATTDGPLLLLSDVAVLRSLEQSLSGVPRIKADTGNGFTLTTGGVDLDTPVFPLAKNLILDNVPMHIVDGHETKDVEGIVFTGMDPSVVQLRVVRDSLNGAAQFQGMRFETLPDFAAGGRYIELENTHPDPDRNLDLTILESLPSYGEPMTGTVGNATIIWGSPGVDSDRDSINDEDEYLAGINPVFADSDGDNLSDPDELAAGTNPVSQDSDGDGIGDGTESAAGSDPLVPVPVGTVLYVRAAPLGSDANTGFGGWGDAIATNAAVESAISDGIPGEPFYVLYDAGAYAPLEIRNRDYVSVVGSLGPDRVVPETTPSTAFDATGVPDVPVLNIERSTDIRVLAVAIQNGSNFGTGFGGGLFIDDRSTVTVADTLIARNSAKRAGGGIYLDSGGLLTLRDTRITANSAVGDDGGGGLAILGGLSMRRVIVADNRYEGSDTSGGGGGLRILPDSDPIDIQDSQFLSNYSATNGGGIWMTTANAPVSLHNNLIAGNANENGLAGGLGGDRLDRGDSVLISSSTIVFNASLIDVDSSGGLHFDNADDLQLRDNISWYNVDADTSDELQDHFQDDSSAALVEFNNFEKFGTTDLFSNHQGNPKFEAGYYLRPDSGARDRGSQSAAAAGLSLPYTTTTDGSEDDGVLDQGYHGLDPAQGEAYAAVLESETAQCPPDSLTLRFRIAAVGGSLGAAHIVAVRIDGDDSSGGDLATVTGIEPFDWSNSQLAIDEGNGVYRVTLENVSHGAGDTAVIEIKVDNDNTFTLYSGELSSLFAAAGC